ncbi:MAG: class I SAM-dependent methyltransferase, partial [Sphingobacteriia bacterium]
MIEAHYEQHYFEWQRKVGVLSAEIILPLFQQHVAEDHRCVDFGCGGGYLLEKIHCTQKIGVEINEVAVRVAEEKGLKVVKDLESIPDQWADVIISNHALEHVLHPADVLATMYRKLKPGGKLVLRVPHEVYAPYNAGDPNKHLYTWSPMNIGNLTTALG